MAGTGWVSVWSGVGWMMVSGAAGVGNAATDEDGGAGGVGSCCAMSLGVVAIASAGASLGTFTRGAAESRVGAGVATGAEAATSGAADEASGVVACSASCGAGAGGGALAITWTGAACWG